MQERIGYFDALGEGWQITWRYKILWLLGLLYAGFGNSGGSEARREVQQQELDAAYQQAGDWIAANWPIVLAGLAVGLLIVTVFIIISVSAQGGLVWGANEAAEGRKPAFGAAFRVGFRRAGRTFMIGFVPFLIMLALSIAYAAALFVAGVGSLFAAVSDGGTVALEGALAAAAGAVLIVGIGGAVVLLIAAFLTWVIIELAVRYGILADYTFGRALGRAWHDLWGRRGAVAFMWVVILASMVVGIGLSILGAPFPERQLGDPLGVWELVSGVVGVVVATWLSVSWTVFFRRMTGMARPEPMPAMPAQPSPVPPAPAPVAPPAPPAPGPIVDVTPVAVPGGENGA